jgi:hypothetical protein
MLLKTYADLERENAQLRQDNAILLGIIESDTAQMRMLVEGREKALRAYR